VTCTGASSGTGPYCGDGIVDGSHGENCDDDHTDETTTCNIYGDCTKCHACTTTVYVGQHCGDGIVNGPEQCDGNSGNCTDIGGGFTGGTFDCILGSCTFDTSMCTTCGNGVREGAEACDTSDFGASTCSNQTGGTKPGGSLMCTGSCTIDTSGCF
jgi:hypothetical protein